MLRRKVTDQFADGCIINLTILPIFLLLCVESSKQPSYCPPSSCGEIQNISFPFRLKSDPQQCGMRDYELLCENNQTAVLELGSKRLRYNVKAITYENYSIRLVDPRLENNPYCLSLPSQSLFEADIPKRIFVTSRDPRNSSTYNNIKINIPVAYLRCASAVVMKSSFYLDTTNSYCSENNSSNNNSISLSNSNLMGNYSYIIYNYEMLRLYDVPDGCGVEASVWVSRKVLKKRPQFEDIRCGLSYGFELFWYRVYCNNLQHLFGEFCYLNGTNGIVSLNGVLQHLLIYVLLSLPATSVIILIVLFIIVVKCVCCGPCLFAFLIYKFRRRHLSAYEAIEDFLQNNNNQLMPVRYTYSQIRKMTSGFREKLGEGGYGTVYKAKLQSGLFAAVKIMGSNKSSKSTSQDFVNEVSTIGRIHHMNVVQLIGYCAQGSKRALVYDFMPNGSLEKYIFSREDETVLFSLISWEKLYEISLGIARGIEYLHRGCHMQILHFDIKPHNILLDENFIPKISDFGLAKLYSTDDSIVPLSGIRGTIGYMAPELFYKNIGGVSYKADVYSFGMLLMEMAGRRKNLNAFADHSSQIYFPTWAYEQLSCGKDRDIIENASEIESKLVKKMIMVALWCIQMKPSDRPSMSKVVEMLEEEDELPQMAPKPFLAPHEVPSENV